MDDLFGGLIQDRETWSLFGQVFLIVFGALLLELLQRRLLKRLRQRTTGAAFHWDQALLDAAGRPISLLIWVVGVGMGAEIVARRTGAVIFEVVEPARDIGVVAALTWFLVRLISAMERNIVERRETAAGEPVDVTTVDAVSKLLRISVVIAATLVVLQTLGISISGILAFGGIGGIAVGFAAKDLLANFFGGLMIYLDRPFAVGDWIRSPDREIEGTVEKIGWRLTCIRTFDKRPLYIPNATFTSIGVENPSRMSHRRIYETIGIRYEDAAAMESIVSDVKQMLIEHPEIDESQTLMVYFTAFAPSSLDFFVYAFTRTTKWAEFHRIKQDVLLRVVDIIDSHGAEIAFPTSTIHLAEAVPSADRWDRARETAGGRA